MNDEKPKTLQDEFPALSPEEIAKIEDAAIRSTHNMGLGLTPVLNERQEITEEELESEIEEALARGEVYEVIQTDTITAHIAQLPVTMLSLDFVVEVLKPIHLGPRFMGVGLSQKELSTDPQTACRELLKQELLREWHEHFANAAIEGDKNPEWVKNVNKVELIECDLLVPKEKKP